jgi:hypothetical protein
MFRVRYELNFYVARAEAGSNTSNLVMRVVGDD